MDLKDELDRPIYWSRLGLDRPLSVRRPVSRRWVLIGPPFGDRVAQSRASGEFRRSWKIGQNPVRTRIL